MRFVLRAARSLKDKRRVVRSIRDRLPGLFGVAVAEVADMDLRQSLVIGLSAVANDGKHVLAVLEKAVNKLRVHPEAQFIDHEIEIFHLAS